MRRYIVVLLDGSRIAVRAPSEPDAILGAGLSAGQDVAHLVVEVEPA